MRYANRGMTLIEVMIVVVIVGILAAIAYPSYRQQVLRAGRAEATATLMQQAQSLEKCFTRYGVYNDVANCPAATAVTNGAALKYQVTVATTATTFVLTATPLGGQVADARCGTFTLNQFNQRTVTGPGGVQICW